MEYGILLGDIFYCKRDDIKIFFQVVGFKANKSVVLKEIEVEEGKSEDGGRTYEIKPIKGKFKKDSYYTPNEITITKLVLKDECYNELYVSIKCDKYRKQYFLYKNEKTYNDYYWIYWH